jgi:hypothetical protein
MARDLLVAGFFIFALQLLHDLLISQPIHEVVAVVSGDPEEPQGWSNAVVSCCDQLGVTLSIVPYDIVFGEKKALRLVRPSEEFPLAGMVLKPAYAGAEALFAKRMFDFAVASILLVLLSPVLAVIALAIKLSEPRQPVLYPWRVIGQNGEPLTSYKFRTMVPNADALKAQLLDRNEMKGPVFKITDDPRVTPVGRFLRKFSLDELPQLWTVVKPIFYSVCWFLTNFPHGCDSKLNLVVPTRAFFFLDSAG